MKAAHGVAVIVHACFFAQAIGVIFCEGAIELSVFEVFIHVDTVFFFLAEVISGFAVFHIVNQHFFAFYMAARVVDAPDEWCARAAAACRQKDDSEGNEV